MINKLFGIDFYKEFGRENILDLYGDVTEQIHHYNESAQALSDKSDKDSKLQKEKHRHQSSFLKRTIDTNYTNARLSGEITLEDMYSNDNAFIAKIV
ncbi:hypothetical protein [Pasteurella atlantica]|uniref:hypothetical protein n=1 Tax=Pasteurellaceae TaxID=712 RepID=UPI00277102D0|nr:hypothetical protein [Pasteurella atlantica]MDP8100098.1 hypothetical protein [Pasteurella atlantica]MDP8106225.1 hypothetical protein [Pasteurella atlantica]MDP8115954.1 hypothetical protein [Pasteurella atlantica]